MLTKQERESDAPLSIFPWDQRRKSYQKQEKAANHLLYPLRSRSSLYDRPDVLQNRKIERVGGTQTIPVDIRIVAATNRNLEKMVANLQFREDLWYRLNVFPILIPALRDRKSDIPALIDHFLKKKAQILKLRQIPNLTASAMEHAMNYHWPRNVRELENVVERALILNTSGPLRFDIIASDKPDSDVPKRVDDETDLPPFHQHTETYFEKALAISGGRINGPKGAALLTGLNPSTLRN